MNGAHKATEARPGEQKIAGSRPQRCELIRSEELLEGHVYWREGHSEGRDHVDSRAVANKVTRSQELILFIILNLAPYSTQRVIIQVTGIAAF